MDSCRGEPMPSPPSHSHTVSALPMARVPNVVVAAVNIGNHVAATQNMFLPEKTTPSAVNGGAAPVLCPPLSRCPVVHQSAVSLGFRPSPAAMRNTWTFAHIMAT